MEASASGGFGLPLIPPPPRAVTEWLSTSDPKAWPRAPEGNGRPVILIPGFLAGDRSLTRMARWLRTGGFTLVRSGITWNTACMARTVSRLEQRLEEAVERSGQPALLVGQSRGGSVGRILAVRRPDLVNALVTLGSPLLDPLAVKPRTWPSIVTVGLLGTVGVPGLFTLECVRGDCCAAVREEAVGPFPEQVRFVSLYSRSDEVVKWEACLDPAATQIEVDSSHIGMGVQRGVWKAVAATL
jgi:pimeloyl-ACP methyl ester carboxylesterase